MSTQTADYLEAIHEMSAGEVRSFDHASWDEYERLLADVGENPGVRISYHRGRLEVMTLSRRHERYSRLLEHFVVILAEECGLECDSCGSMTIRKSAADSGTEPDGCYYIQNAERMRDRAEPDFSVDPPPDLALEVDITHGSPDKLAIYAALGVPEVWRYDGVRAEFYCLTAGRYAEVEASGLFPFLTSQTLAAFIVLGVAEGNATARHSFREWVRTHKPS
jgi:Uma2 family endonuclease